MAPRDSKQVELKRQRQAAQTKSPVAIGLAIVLCALSAIAPVHAQSSLKRKLLVAGICGTVGLSSFKIADRLADAAIAKAKVQGPDADKMRLSFRVGVAAALCVASAALANTIYGRLSKRDQEARQREMRAALADAQPGTRNYVLPDSQLPGRLETLPAERDGDRECRLQLDTLGKSSDPVAARWCRKVGSNDFEVDLGG